MNSMRQKGGTRSPKVSPFRPLGGGFKQNLSTTNATTVQVTTELPLHLRTKNSGSQNSLEIKQGPEVTTQDSMDERGPRSKAGASERFKPAVGSGVFSIEQVKTLEAIVEQERRDNAVSTAGEPKRADL